MNSERGVVAVEFGLALPVLLLLGAALLSLGNGLRAANDVERALGAGLRYATKVERNAVADDCGPYTRRRSNVQVQAFITAAARGAVASPADVRVLVDGGPGDLCTATSGATVTTEASYVVPLGLFGDIANALGRLVGAGDVFSETRRTAAAHGVLE